MRIIEVSVKHEKRVTHKDCGAVIGYYLREVQERTYADYDGGSETIRFIICPHCGKEIHL